jgi:hypothetical protein
VGGTNLQIPYNTGAGATSFIAAPTIASTYLQYNGTGFTWAASAGVGTVTSVGQTFTGGLISVSGSPITTAGTLALTVAGTSGGIPYFSSGTTWATSAALAANALVIGGGAGAAPATTTTGTGVVTALGVNTGTAGAFVVNGGALGTPSSGTVTNLTGTASININGTVGATTQNTGGFSSVLINTSTSQTGAVLAVTGGIQGTIKSGTSVASTSGTSIDFTSIPSWVKRITVILQGVSTNGTSNLLVQIGSGSVTTSGYVQYASNVSQGVVSSAGTGFAVGLSVAAADARNGICVLSLITGNTWVMSSNSGAVVANSLSWCNGYLALGGALDRVRITSVTPDTFDAGNINILYEG